jgi:hypothetical protein
LYHHKTKTTICVPLTFLTSKQGVNSIQNIKKIRVLLEQFPEDLDVMQAICKTAFYLT